MEKEKILTALKKAREGSTKRKFSQSIDLIMNLKELDVSKPDNKVSEYIVLPNGRGKKIKIGAFVGAELKAEAEKLCDVTIVDKDFPKWNDKGKMKKMSRSCTFFIAQADVMPAVAKQFGKYLSVVGRMPDPKAGQVIPPNANLKIIIEKFQKVARAFTKKSPNIQTNIGIESMKDEELADNVAMVIDTIQNKLPQGKSNIKEILIKTTMGKPVKVE